MDRLGGYWLYMIPAWLWAFLPLWAASGGVICIGEGMLLLITAAPAALVWLTGCVVAAVHHNRVEVRKSRSVLLCVSVPVLWAIALALATTDLPMFARFYLSEPALHRLAEGGDSGTSRDKDAKYIGWFHVEEVWRHGRTVAFITDRKLFESVGVIYAPDGLPTDLPMEVETLLFARFTHIHGAWYKFEMP